MHIDHIPISLLPPALTRSEMDPNSLLTSSAIGAAVPFRSPISSRSKSARPKATHIQAAPISIPMNRTHWRGSREIQSSYDSGCEADCDSDSDGDLEPDNSDAGGQQCHSRSCSVDYLGCQYCYHEERFCADHFAQLQTFEDPVTPPLQALDSEDTTSFSMSYSSSWSMTEK